MSPEEQNARGFYVALVALALVLFWLVLRPFVEALFLAAVLAGALHPAQAWLCKRLGGRPTLSAVLLSTAVVLVVLTPLVALGAVLVRELVHVGKHVADALQDGGVLGVIDSLPPAVRKVAHDLLSLAPVDPSELDNALREKVTAQQGRAAQLAQRTLTTTGSIALQSSLMVIALFFLLLDGKRLVGWLEQASPLRRGETSELLVEFRKVSVSVIVSSLATGIVQTTAALIGYLIAGVPGPWVFALVTFFMSFVPAIGAGGTCLVAALVLLASGKLGMAIFLAVWGVVTVGLSDNVVKPLLARRGMGMHGAVVFFALVGGITAFGAIGLILGPLIVSFLLTLVRMRKRDATPAVLMPGDA